MSNSTKVASIDSEKPRQKRTYAFPQPIARALTQHQWRAREALAVAELLCAYIRSAPPGGPDIDTLDNSAGALVRMLKSIENIDEPEDLLRAANELANE